MLRPAYKKIDVFCVKRVFDGGKFVMKVFNLDKEEYQGINLYTMKQNNNDGIPVFIRKVVYDSAPLSPIHRHEAIQVNYVNRGKLIHKINNSQYELVKGDIFIIPPYIPHQLIHIENYDFEIIELEFIPSFIFDDKAGHFYDLDINSSIFDFSYIEPFLVAECNVKPRLNVNGKNQLIVENLLDDIYTEYNTRDESFLLAIKADILKLLVLVARCFRENIEQSDTVQLFNHHRNAMIHVIQYINEHYEDAITIEEVSRLAMLSQSYFSYLFKTITNKTFVEYLNSLRIERAMDTLKNTDKLVVEICFECGFKNVNHFNRTFKNMAGVSPTDYRKSNRNH
jgi:AraC-like DNA-binding protein/quercetin dioxygenase-like cupin family protein